MWQTVDPDGREIVLNAWSWGHILVRHPDLAVDRRDLLDTVADPDRRAEGPKPGEEWFYRRGLGPSAWIRVVVHYEHGRGRIVTAFPRRRFP